MKALVTGQVVSSVRLVFNLVPGGWEVIGVDNDSRGSFLGTEGSTAKPYSGCSFFPEPEPCRLWISATAQACGNCLRRSGPDLSFTRGARSAFPHLAASIPYEDFDVNAVGTLNLLVALATSVGTLHFVSPAATKSTQIGEPVPMWNRDAIRLCRWTRWNR